MSVATTQPVHPHAPYRHLSSRFDEQHKALWLILDPHPKACFAFDFLEELQRFLGDVGRLAEGTEEERHRIRYFIVASKSPGVFNLGGDLALFSRCVRENDRETLWKYAVACIDTLYPYIVAFRLPLTTIALVQGDAFGGGFEVALSADVLIAERKAQLGFPEVLFNLFPGMGAYNLLNRRVGMRDTERMLLNGKLYRAEEMHAEGIVDVLAEDGHGESAVYEQILRDAGRGNARRGVQQVRRKLCPVRYEELLAVAEIWVDTALRIDPRGVRLMERVARSQERNHRRDAAPAVAGIGRISR